MLFIDTLIWYIPIQILAVLAFLFTFKIFFNNEDKGYCISKLIGVCSPALISWLLIAFSFGELGLNKTTSIISTIVFSIIVGAYIFTQYKKEDYNNLINFIKERFKFIIFVEACFLLILVFGTFIRGFSPDILGGKKLLDLVYTNSFIFGQGLTPENLWFSGNVITVPSFSYFLFGNLSNICPLPIYTEFNIMPATIISILAIISGGLILNLTKNKTFAILAGIITPFITTFFIFIYMLKKGLGYTIFWNIPSYETLKHFLIYTPLECLLNGNLQPYFLFMPLLLGFIYIIFTSIKDSLYLHSTKFTFNKIFNLLLICFSLLACILTNIYSSLICLLLIFTVYTFIINKNEDGLQNIKVYIYNLSLYFGLTLLLLIPYLLTIQIPDVWVKLLEIDKSTLSNGMLTIFGSFFIVITCYLIFIYKNYLQLSLKNTLMLLIFIFCLIETYFLWKANLSILVITAVLSILLILIAISAGYSIFIDTKTLDIKKQLLLTGVIILISIALYLFSTSLITVICFLILGYSIYKCYQKKDLTEYTTFSFVIVLSLCILIFSNLGISINTGNNNYLNNNIFSNIQVLSSLCVIMIIFYSVKLFSGVSKEVYITTISILLLPCFIFLIFGTSQNTNNFRILEGLTPKLSGINHMKVFHNNEYQAISWLKQYAGQKSIILEAINPGDPFCGRISAYSNKQSVLSWPYIQKNFYNKAIQKNINEIIEDINTIYSEVDKEKVIPLINKYEIDYIYVGEIAKKLYSDESLSGFKDIANNCINFDTDKDKEVVLYQLH